MEHCAGQHSVNGKADSSLHAEQALNPICLQYRLLKLAHVLRRRIAGDHMLFPDAFKGVRDSLQLRPQVHNDSKIVVAMHVGDEV